MQELQIGGTSDAWHVLAALGTIATAAVASAALIIVLRPLLARYALARPNARSSHVVPTRRAAASRS